MKNWIKFSLTSLFLATMLVGFAQEEGTTDDRDLQYFRNPGKKGINIFETPKDNTVKYTGEKVRLGGNFSMVFQGLDHQTSLDGTELVTLSKNFQLPTANLNLDVQLQDGLRMHLRTYLSSRNHAESYVKGGYMQMDKLDFISPGLLSGFMEKATIRVGMDQFNYGDVQFRRADNAASTYNPFVSNYIMDAFSTEPFLELTYQTNGWLGVIGVTNGRLNQAPTTGDNGFAYFAKLGFDKQLSDDLRFRLTGSIYSSSDQGTRDYLYGGDRAGGRYFNIFQVAGTTEDNNFLPRFNPSYPYQTSIQFNPFVKYAGLEFFGVYEIIKNGDDNHGNEGGLNTGTGVSNIGGGFNQVGAELLYRIGAAERFYVGFRYNKVSGEQYDEQAVGGIVNSTTWETQEITRTNFGLGFFMTDNVLTKFEVVNQKYEGAGWEGTVFQGGKFNGFNIEAVISF